MCVLSVGERSWSQNLGPDAGTRFLFRPLLYVRYPDKRAHRRWISLQSVALLRTKTSEREECVAMWKETGHK